MGASRTSKGIGALGEEELLERDIIQGKMTQDRTLRNSMFRVKWKDLPDGANIRSCGSMKSR